MADTARCSPCDINYPDNKKLCPMCKQPLWLTRGKHDTDWATRVSQWERRVKPNTFLPDCQVELLIHESGEHFCHADKLAEAGYLDLGVGSILRLNGSFWEADGMVFKDTDAEGWWLKEVPVEGVFDDATPQDFTHAGDEEESGASI